MSHIAHPSLATTSIQVENNRYTTGQLIQLVEQAIVDSGFSATAEVFVDEANRISRNAYDKLAEKVFEFVQVDLDSPTELATRIGGLLEIAAEQNPELIEHAANPSDEYIFKALEIDGNNIKFVKNPTEEMKVVALRTYSKYIHEIESPTLEMFLAATSGNARCIDGILDIIPEEMWTTELAMNIAKAVSYNCKLTTSKVGTRADDWIADFIPKKFLTEELGRVIWDRYCHRLKKAYVSQYYSELLELFPAIPARNLLEVCGMRGSFLNLVDEKYITEPACMAAIGASPSALKYVPAKLQTPALCKAAIQVDWTVLEHVINQTEDIVEFAMEISPAAITLVRSADPKVIAKAFMNNSTGFQKLKNKTVELCLAAVTAYPQNLKHVPAKLQTEDVLWAAIEGFKVGYKGDGLNTYLKYSEKPFMSLVKVSKLTQEMVNEIIKYEPKHLCDVPAKFLTPEVVRVGCEGGAAFHWLPKEYQTKEMAEITAKANPSMLNKPGLEMLSENLVDKVLEEAPQLLLCIDKPSPKMITRAAQNILKAGWGEMDKDTKYVRQYYSPRTKTLHVELFKRIEKIGTVEDVATMVSLHPIQIAFVEKQTERLCMAAIESNPEMLEYIDVKTYSICLAALSRSQKALQFVPEEYL